MSKKNALIKGTIILTLTGFASRIIGFFYRIFLSQSIGAKGMGIYQLIFPIQTLCYALCVSGIQTSISKLAAAYLAKGEKREAKRLFQTALLFSTIISTILSVLLYQNASYLSIHILHESRCLVLLQLLAFSIPFGCIHACITGYYYALKQTAIPSLSLLLEQLVRVVSTYFVYIALLNKNSTPTALIAVMGVLAGEVTSMLFTTCMIRIHFKRTPGYSISHKTTTPSLHRFHYLRELLSLSTPLTANRVLINIMHAIETILIPIELQAFGFKADTALGVYGILTGMALPLILFPSAITNSVSVMLLPAVAEQDAKGNKNSIRDTIDSTIKYCLILGIFSTAIFFLYGQSIGTILFKNNSAGTMIQTLAFICPFLYLTTTLSSIMNGLGKTTFCFLQNVIGLGIRILFVMFLIPIYGVKGYLWGILVSEGTITLCCILYLSKIIPFSFSLYKRLFSPTLGILLCIGITEFFRFLFIKDATSFFGLCLQIIVLTVTYFYYLCMRNLIHLPLKRHSC